MSSGFSRMLPAELISSLRNEPIFTDKLLPDIRKGEVFPAIRAGYVDFYYRGRGLLSYRKDGFRTHYKYTIKDHLSSNNYVLENEIRPTDYIIRNYYEGYESIKAGCRLYARSETELISSLYRQSLTSLNRMPGSDGHISLLDIESAFVSEKDITEEVKRNTTDKIDLVLLNCVTFELFFCEVKRYGDNRTQELLRNPQQLPELVEQIERYEAQITNNGLDIAREYAAYITTIGDLMQTPYIIQDLKVISRVVLLLTEYSHHQIDRVQQIVECLGTRDIRVKAVGSINEKTPAELYRLVIS